MKSRLHARTNAGEAADQEARPLPPALLHLVLGALPDAVVILDRDWRYVYANARAEELADAAGGELAGRSALEVFPVAGGRGWEAELRRSWAELRPLTVEQFYPRLNVWMEHRTRPSADALALFSSDITERKRLETDLRSVMETHRDNEIRYRAFIENSSEVIWRFDLHEPLDPRLPVEAQIEHIYRHGFLAECNEAMVRTYGFKSPGEAVGTPLDDLMPRAEPRNVDYLSAFIAAGYRLIDAESHEVGLDGEPRHFLNNLVGIVEGGRVTRAWGTSRDITERKKTEAALRDSEERLRLIVENALDYAIVILDDARRITFWSPGAESVFAYSAAEMRGRLFDELFTPEDRANHVPAAECDLARRQSVCREERWHRRAEGERFWGSGLLMALPDTARGRGGFLKIVRDATRRKQDEESLEARVRERTAELERANAQLKTYSYSVAHDLRAPLRSVLGFSGLLRERLAQGAPAEEAAEFLGRIERAAQRMDELLVGLLAYNQAASEPVAEGQVTSLESAVREALRKQASLVAARGAVVSVQPGLPAVRGPASLVVPALEHLLGNALKFVPAERVPVVTVYSETKDGRVALYVEDNGLGIEASQHERIFGLFERLHPAGVYAGSGVGLAIVRRVAGRLGGSSTLRSRPGEGSRFCLELPAAG